MASEENMAFVDSIFQEYKRSVFTVRTVLVQWPDGQFVNIGIVSVAELLCFAIYRSNITGKGDH